MYFSIATVPFQVIEGGFLVENCYEGGRVVTEIYFLNRTGNYRTTQLDQYLDRNLILFGRNQHVLLEIRLKLDLSRLVDKFG